MFKKAILVMLLISGACMINSASALYLKVDLAYPEMVSGDPCFVERFDLTAKDGWFPWATRRWKDCYQHDMVWAGTNVDEGPIPGGINGTGVNIQIRSVRPTGELGGCSPCRMAGMRQGTHWPSR